MFYTTPLSRLLSGGQNQHFMAKEQEVCLIDSTVLVAKPTFQGYRAAGMSSCTTKKETANLLNMGSGVAESPFPPFPPCPLPAPFPRFLLLTPLPPSLPSP
jgi:hypothetical protein